MDSDSELLEKMAKLWLSWSDTERESFSNEVPPVAKEVSEAAGSLLSDNASVRIEKLEGS